MATNNARINWSDFLGRPPTALDTTLAEAAVRDQSVLITGAGGSIGSGLARAVLAGRPRTLVLLDLSESALYEGYRRLSGLANGAATKIIPITGNIADRRLLAHLFHLYHPDLVLHAAAYKHVPLMERNPFSAISNNAIGTYTLVSAALEAGVGRLLAISTDKAVKPHSMMGASKRIAEQFVLSHATNSSRMNAIRLCNVLGSVGSVAPIFQEQADNGLPLTVTHADAQRYFLTPAEAEVAILRAAAGSERGRVLIPDCGQPLHIVDLARFIADHYNDRSGQDARIEIIGLRPGDKLREELLSDDEIVESEHPDGMRVVFSPVRTVKEMVEAKRGLQDAVESFDYALLMRIVIELVPGYRPPGVASIGQAVLEAR